MKHVRIPCLAFGFSLGLYNIALTQLDRYDGMCIKAHPVMASIIADVIREQPFRLPIVPDRRNRPNEVAILDLSSTGGEVVTFDDLAVPFIPTLT